METKDIKELTLTYVTSWLILEVIRRKEQQIVVMDNAALVAHHKSGGELSRAQGEPPLCFYCGKPGYYAHICWKEKNNQREKAHKAKVDYA